MLKPLLNGTSSSGEVLGNARLGVEFTDAIVADGYERPWLPGALSILRAAIR